MSYTDADGLQHVPNREAEGLQANIEYFKPRYGLPPRVDDAGPEAVYPTEYTQINGGEIIEKKKRRICGLSVLAFWIVVVVLVIIVAAAIGGGIGGGLTTKRKSDNSSNASLPLSALISSTSTATSSTSSSSTSTSSRSSSSIVSNTSSPSSPSPTSSPTSATASSTSSAPAFSSTACPVANGTLYTTSFSSAFGSAVGTFQRYCLTNFAIPGDAGNFDVNLQQQITPTLDACMDACVQYNSDHGGTVCIAVTWDNFSQLQNECWLKNGTGTIFPGADGSEVDSALMIAHN